MSDRLLPTENNKLPEKNDKLTVGLDSLKEIGYGEQLSSFTELKQGMKSGNLFKPSTFLESNTRRPGCG